MNVMSQGRAEKDARVERVGHNYYTFSTLPVLSNSNTPIPLIIIA